MNWVAQFWLGLVLACCGGLALCTLCFPCIAIMDGVPTGGVGRRITRATLDGLAAPSVLEQAPDLRALAVYPGSLEAKDLARKKSGGPQESTSHRRSDTIRSWYGGVCSRCVLSVNRHAWVWVGRGVWRRGPVARGRKGEGGGRACPSASGSPCSRTVSFVRLLEGCLAKRGHWHGKAMVG